MDLSTTYLGMQLKNPVVAAASPLTAGVSSICRLAEAGAGAIVLHSLFEEEVDLECELLDRCLNFGVDSSAEVSGYFPWVHSGRVADQYFELIQEARKRVDVPIIASLNGTTSGGWTRYARGIEEAGAHALELNLYYLPVDPEVSGSEVEQRLVDTVRQVHSHISIPLAVKPTLFLSSPAHMARRLVEAGARGLVFFNRFYQPDFDLDNLTLIHRVGGSRSTDLVLRATWIALLFGRVDADFALSGGVHDHLDVLKAMMAGARVVEVATALLRHGPERIRHILESMGHWMEDRDYRSVAQMQGSMSQMRVAEPEAFERAHYLRSIHSWYLSFEPGRSRT